MLKSLAYSAEEVAEHKAEQAKYSTMPPDEHNAGPKYPWGLELRLEKGSLDKLGLSVVNFKGGQEVSFTATAKVTSINMSENEDGTKHECLCLTVTAMDLGSGSTDEQKKTALYGE